MQNWNLLTPQLLIHLQSSSSSASPKPPITPPPPTTTLSFWLCSESEATLGYPTKFTYPIRLSLSIYFCPPSAIAIILFPDPSHPPCSHINIFLALCPCPCPFSRPIYLCCNSLTVIFSELSLLGVFLIRTINALLSIRLKNCVLV